jgi:hypothetical protein
VDKATKKKHREYIDKELPARSKMRKNGTFPKDWWKRKLGKLSGLSRLQGTQNKEKKDDRLRTRVSEVQQA